METQHKFYLQTANNVPAASSTSIRLGYPEPQTMLPDICICRAGSMEFIPLNSIILRNTLLNSKEFLKRYLRIDLVDLTQQPQQEEQPAKKAVPVKPKKVKGEAQQ